MDARSDRPEKRYPQRPPPARKAFIEILSPKPGEECRAWAAAATFVPIVTHYVNHVTVPCLAETAYGCAIDHAKTSNRWKAYLAAYHATTGKRVIMELTSEAVRTSRLLMALDHDLRGRKIVTRRRGKAKNSPMFVEVLFDKLPIPQPEFRVVPHLAHLWDVPEVYLYEATCGLTIQHPFEGDPS